MLLLAGVVLAVFMVRLLATATTAADAILPADGSRQVLDLPPDEERMLFRRDDIEAVPDCLVGPAEGPGRAPAGLWADVRTDAEGGTWHAFGRFDTGDGPVALQCASPQSLEVRVGMSVGFRDVFGPFGLLVLAPGVLGIAGLVLVVHTALRRSTPAAAPPPRGPAGSGLS